MLIQHTSHASSKLDMTREDANAPWRRASHDPDSIIQSGLGCKV